MHEAVARPGRVAATAATGRRLPAARPLAATFDSAPLARNASACACGGSCPRCQGNASRGLIQREPAPDASASSDAAEATPQQEEGDESQKEMCGAGELTPSGGGPPQVYMCCFSNAPAGHPCWQVRADVFNDCFKKTKSYELCLGKSNFAACRCFGDKYCHCGGLV